MSEPAKFNPPTITESAEDVQLFRPGWWLRVLRVRLRFFLIALVAGLIVGQWPVVRGVWDRWIWATSHKHALGSVSGSQEYFCPMDPGVVSIWPAICPICNMDLVPRKKMDAQLLPEGVVARMQLSPYRIQLAGVKTTVVELRPMEIELSFSGALKKLENGSFGYDSIVSEEDAARIVAEHPATAVTRTHSKPIPAIASVLNGTKHPTIRVVITGEHALPAGTFVTTNVMISMNESGESLAVPESSVVDRGNQKLVYVESMPGMFDGVAVELGQRCGSYYPVIKGLKSGQRVATSGSFLIDAETRLNPSLATGYFGASQSTSPIPSSTPPPTPAKPQQKSTPSKQPLSREDQELAKTQKICPVTELPLDSMGGPLPVIVKGTKVFICCAGCESRLKSEPDKYLARLQAK